MTTDPEAILKAYHQKYCDLTGTSPKFNLWLRSWYEFQKAGFDVSDLECVLKWIARENRKNDFQRSNSLMKLIGGDLTQFDSLLCEARATERNRKVVSPQKQVVEQFRRFGEGDVAPAARTIGQVLQDMKEKI